AEPSLPRKLLEELVAADEFFGRKQWDRAREIFDELDRRFPKRKEVLGLLTEVSARQGDMHTYQAPWYLPVSSWISERTIKDLATALGPAARRRDDEGIARDVRCYLDQHPELTSLVPALLDRSDAAGCPVSGAREGVRTQ